MHKDPKQKCVHDPDVRKCRRCRVMYIEVSGCNNMSCTCGSHNCFKCGACLRLAGECYEHLSEKHGGCFDVPPE